MLVETKQGVNPARRKSWLFVLAKRVLRRRRKPRLSPPMQQGRYFCTCPAALVERREKSGRQGGLARQSVLAKQVLPPAAQGTVCPNSSCLRHDLLEPASDTLQKRHGREVRALKEFCPLRGQGTSCPNSLHLRCNQSEPASDTQQKQHRLLSVLFLWRALRSSNP